MKTAISVPDAVFQAAERLARRLGLSRSELYTRALARFLEEQRYQGVTERLDAVYSAEPDTAEQDALVADLQRRVLDEEDW